MKKIEYVKNDHDFIACIDNCVNEIVDAINLLNSQPIKKPILTLDSSGENVHHNADI